MSDDALSSVGFYLRHSFSEVKENKATISNTRNEQPDMEKGTKVCRTNMGREELRYGRREVDRGMTSRFATGWMGQKK